MNMKIRVNQAAIVRRDLHDEYTLAMSEGPAPTSRHVPPEEGQGQLQAPHQASGFLVVTKFFTSDLHLGHANIIDLCGRPFDDVESMNEALVDNWNATVTPNDEVWVLGDVALGKTADILPTVSRLNGIKHLLPGNHDRCWRGHKKVGTWPQRYLDAGFASIRDNQPVGFRLPGLVEQRELVLMHHFPYRGDSHTHEDRYREHRPVDHGALLLHGHVHDAWKRKGRMVNVGVDVWGFRPASLDEISMLLLND